MIVSYYTNKFFAQYYLGEREFQYYADFNTSIRC